MRSWSSSPEATADDFREHLFGLAPFALAFMAEVDGEPVGFAWFFRRFQPFAVSPVSTWKTCT